MKLSELRDAAVAADQALTGAQGTLDQAKASVDEQVKALQAQLQGNVDTAETAESAAQAADASAWSAFVGGLSKAGGKAAVPKGDGTIEVYTLDSSVPLGYTVATMPIDPDV